ncbi:MAG: cobalt ABC transporter ATP-binding protein [Deltaproteobacteria bacterium]|nr:MAG: cobalt ABC transporter ATP-binding protein [Deltaproteobacteria bacterium]
MLEVLSLQVSYHDVEAVRGVSFSLPEGERTGLVGPNGAGKSTLLLALDGLVPFSGQVRIGGLEVVRRNLAQVRRQVGIVFADSEDQLFMPTLLEDVAFGPLNLGLERDQALARARGALDRLGLQGMAERSSHHLSDGERRRAAVATVLAMRPRLWLFDEPATNLDPWARRDLVRVICQLEGTVLLASHDLDLVVQTCNRCLVMDEGRVVADGPVRQILGDEKLMESHRLEVPLRLRLSPGGKAPCRSPSPS